jgi:hypothetical protein
MSHAIPLRRPGAVSCDIVRLTPADARRLLEHNTHNRGVQDRLVLKYAAAMEAGLWRMNGEAIKIGSSGTILDGQHRLEALALQAEGTGIEFLVIRGVDDAAQSTMDQGKLRGLNDILSLEGIESDKSLAAAVRAYLLWQRGLLFVDTKTATAQLSNQWILLWARDNNDTIELLRRGLAYRKIPARPALTAAIYTRVAEAHNVDTAEEFFQGTADGKNLAEGSPVLALRNRLYRMQGQNRDNVRTKISDRDIIGLFVTAFNAWVLGRPLAKLQRPTGKGYTQQHFPEIARTKGAKTR